MFSDITYTLTFLWLNEKRLIRGSYMMVDKEVTQDETSTSQNQKYRRSFDKYYLLSSATLVLWSLAEDVYRKKEDL